MGGVMRLDAIVEVRECLRHALEHAQRLDDPGSTNMLRYGHRLLIEDKLRIAQRALREAAPTPHSNQETVRCSEGHEHPLSSVPNDETCPDCQAQRDQDGAEGVSR